MAIQDLKISSQLRIGLGLILIFVLLLGLLMLRQNDELWLQTRSLYNHPLQVSRAVGELKTDISALRMTMRDLFLTESDQKMEKDLQQIEVYRTDISRHLKTITNHYLGPRKNIAGLQDDLAKWNAYHEETIRLIRDKKIDKALARTTLSNAEGGLTEVLMTRIQTLDDLAKKMGDQFYNQATEKNIILKHQVYAIVCTILLLSLLVSGFLLKSLRTPLQQLTEAAEQFRRGKLDARSRYVSKNEFGLLSSAFDAMADTVETQMRINDQATRISDVMLREVDSREFCRELIRELIDQTGSQIGAIYLLNQQKTEFEIYESIGISDHNQRGFSAVNHEGEFGAALATKKMQRITKIPEDTRFIFTAVSGTFLPREIITLPVLSGKETVAVISLTSIHGYDENIILLLETIHDTLIARMNGVLAFRQVQELAERLDQQNLELKSQKQELAAQASELSRQNTELVRQKKELNKANRLKNTFLSNMSHELRTPLNSVIALSSVLGRRLKKKISEEEVRYLEVIERNGKDLLNLINDILDLSRIESGREEINPSRFSLKQMVQEIVEMLSPMVRDKGIVLSNQMSDDLPPVISDAVKVKHILQNLIVNAVKFTEHGSVDVSARLLPDEFHVVVKDTGIGIDADHLTHIFEEFRQGDEGTARKYEGSGLGLAIAKKYATLLQGGIEVASTVGHGSVFTLKLPYFEPLPKAGKKISAPLDDHRQGKASSPKATPGNGQCLLVVEDSEPAAIQLIDILTEQGYRVQVAQNGWEALKRISENPPAAVILDLMMPEMDGFEVLRQIRSSEKTVSLPVLILTAKHVSKKELDSLTGNKIHQLIQKGGISKDELLTAVAEMVMPPKPATQARPLPVITPRDGTYRVLIVEDNPDNLLTIKAVLEDTCRLKTAENGIEALDLARKYRPDLILMDLALPLMDGFTTLDAIRADEVLSQIPVLAVTASAMTGDREEILDRGFDGYISKPIDDKEFRQTLHKILYGNEDLKDIGNRR